MSGHDVDLAACDYGPGVQGQFRTGPARYYRLLAGLAKIAQARSIVEVGTHYGGSARALAEGQKAAGLSPRVLTFDVEDRAGAPILGVEGVERVLADVRHPDGAAQLATWLGSNPVDLLFVDALKDREFVETTVQAVSQRAIQWMVLDDIFANMSIRAAWNRIRAEYDGRSAPIDEVVLGVRSGGYGQGVVAVAHQALAGLSVDPLREAGRHRWSAAVATLLARRPRDDSGTLAGYREVAASCRGEGEIVTVGANQPVVRALAHAAADRNDLGGVSVTVLGGFFGQGSVSDPHYEPPVKRGEPTLDEFRGELGDAASRTNILAGDVPTVRWPGRPIELMVVEWNREPSRLAYAWGELLPWCIPGGSLVIVEGVSRQALTAPAEDLGVLRPHLEILGVGRTCVALAPVSTPDPATLLAISQPSTEVRWSPLGVPYDIAAPAGAPVT